jgi:hypothetical protein
MANLWNKYVNNDQNKTLIAQFNKDKGKISDALHDGVISTTWGGANQLGKNVTSMAHTVGSVLNNITKPVRRLFDNRSTMLSAPGPDKVQEYLDERRDRAYDFFNKNLRDIDKKLINPANPDLEYSRGLGAAGLGTAAIAPLAPIAARAGASTAVRHAPKFLKPIATAAPNLYNLVEKGITWGIPASDLALGWTNKLNHKLRHAGSAVRGTSAIVSAVMNPYAQLMKGGLNLVNFPQALTENAVYARLNTHRPQPREYGLLNNEINGVLNKHPKLKKYMDDKDGENIVKYLKNNKIHLQDIPDTLYTRALGAYPHSTSVAGALQDPASVGMQYGASIKKAINNSISTRNPAKRDIVLQNLYGKKLYPYHNVVAPVMQSLAKGSDSDVVDTLYNVLNP